MKGIIDFVKDHWPVLAVVILAVAVLIALFAGSSFAAAVFILVAMGACVVDFIHDVKEAQKKKKPDFVIGVDPGKLQPQEPVRFEDKM